MKRNGWYSPGIEYFFFSIIAILLIYFLVFAVACYGQECADGKCDRANASPQSQVRFAPAGTVESQKNPAVARLEHDDYKGRGYFTGFFIVAPNGLRTNILVTAAHCFDGPGETRIYLPDGRIFKGEILELDHVWDVAVVRVEGSNIPAMRLATKAPVRGDKISAYGYGWVGKQYARINGVAIGYSIFKGQRVANTLKCSFQIRDGDSGGPMVNSRCEVVAVMSCSDDQSGTHGTWAARIKVIVDRAIARKIKQTSFSAKEKDTDKLPLLPVTQRVAPPAVEAGAAGVADDANADVIKRLRSMFEIQPLLEKRENHETPQANTATGTAFGLPELSVTPAALSVGLQVAAAIAGVGLTGGVGWGGWVALRMALSAYRKINKKNWRSADSPADSFSTLQRESKEAKQLLQLSELEGRSPLFDALIGRLALDELDDAIDGNRPEKDFAIQFKEKLIGRFNEIAPVSVEKKE